MKTYLLLVLNWRIYRCIFLIILCIQASGSRGQDTLKVTLTDIINIAREQSLSSQVASKSLSNQYWAYQAVLADFNPQISLSANLSDFNRSIQRITLPDGAEAFVQQKLMRNRINVGVSQDIALTGGSIYVGTGLQRLDLFGDSNSGKSKSYLTTPIFFSLVQPLFRFNHQKWNKKMAPIYYREAQSEFAEDLENVSYYAASLFFDLLTLQINLVASEHNLREAKSLLQLTQGQYDVGQVAETALLQMRLNVMNANAGLSSIRQDYHASTEALRNYIGITQKVFFQLLVPEAIPNVHVDEDRALAYAQLNRSDIIEFDRRALEAQRNLEAAKLESGPNASLYFTFGLSQTGNELKSAYQSPLDNEQFQIGLSLPIADWGKARSRIEIAKSNKELLDLQLQQAKLSFTHEISIRVQQFELVEEQVKIAIEAYNISQRRLEMTRGRYRIGRAAITDLNLALSEEANARKGYVTALRAYWMAYYDIRRMTLYDFENEEPLKK